ncbi:hypothetical protein [Novosphingobium sp. EMRT-2]|uniref:hypothetical protein n=1 Tax=Novosphingobium sp. EMRT-2 TaxID=2571749 RepID=UPI0010BDE90F|nr:hypothetical protein [Novosphingobium sp. EMRT-2]QCI93956.1 hypothetical protein FA702_10630 [Novosphingobium sp. EMRT-2]
MAWDSASGAAAPDGAPVMGAAIADSPPGAASLTDTWNALHEAAAIVGALAGRSVAEDAGASPAAIEAFPATILHAGGWRLALAQQGMDDLAAILETGVSARGRSPAHAAMALHDEFRAARAALLALVAPAPVRHPV